MSETLRDFYRQQLEGLQVEFDDAIEAGDDRDVRALCAVAVTCLLRLAGVL